MRGIRGASYDDGRVETIRGDLPRPARPSPRSRAQTGGPRGPASPAYESRGARAEPGWLEHALSGVKRIFDKDPKSTYRRADAVILEDLCESLGDQHPDAREIEVAVDDGNVVLTGCVRSRGERWMAADIAAETLGVRSVMNQIRVR